MEGRVMHDHDEKLEVIDEKLSVDVVGSEIVLDGRLPVAVSLTAEAALDTGIDLLRAALEADTADQKGDKPDPLAK